MLLFLLAINLPTAVAQERSAGWDNLIEISHQFTWYPRKDVQQLLKIKGDEYEWEE
jgi:hypothetical protein